MWNPFKKAKTKELEVTKEPKVNREAINYAVYHVLNAKLDHVNDLIIWLSRNYDLSYWEPRLRKDQTDIDSIRKWAEALPYGPVRSEYLHWLTYYYQIGLDDAWKELRTQRKKHEMDEYHRELTKNYAASITLDIPKP